MKKNLIFLLVHSLISVVVLALLISVAACETTPATVTPTPTSTSSPESSPTSTVTPSTSPTPTMAPPIISTRSLPDAVVGTDYSQTLQATSVGGNITWAISSCSLPVGLTLDSGSGTISGTPNLAATYFFSVLALDSAGASSSQGLSITVNLSTSLESAIIITTNSLPDGLVGTSYNQSLQAIGGSGGNKWSIVSGSLPTGLSLDAATAKILGIPTATGTTSFTIEATDSSGSNVTQSLSLTITASSTATPNSTVTPSPTSSSTMQPGGITITTSSLPAGVVGTNYSQSLKLTGGSSPFSWSYLRGSLPTGMFLDAQLGIIFGTPDKSGISYFLVQVIDGTGTINTQSLSITINTQ
jgi:large repetitive protein